MKYSTKNGFYGVDHSYHVGNPYFSLDTNLNSVDENAFINSNGGGPCLVFNKNTELWEKNDPCSNAVGVCKSKLGRTCVIYFTSNKLVVLKGIQLEYDTLMVYWSI